MVRRQRSYPANIREQARRLRSEGLTYREIIATLGGNIPKNTLSNWVRDVPLTTEQQARIRQIELEARARGRALASVWHREQKCERMAEAQAWAAPLATQLSRDSQALMALAAGLWLGEGSKRDDVLKLANSDPRIIRGWLALLRNTFEIDQAKLACQLALSEGMPDGDLRSYWSGVTGIPLDRFLKSSIKRVKPSRTRQDYKGVCVVIYYSAELRRQIGFLGWEILERVADEGL